MSQPNEAIFSGDESAFQGWIDQYAHELLVHCYRILSSLEDAEDALQETWLRAWRRLASLETQSSLRAWLYKIATNVSLDMLDHRKSRALPTSTHAPADPRDPLPQAINDPIWLDPLPDVYLDGYVINPEARYEAHESVTLAFLAALQKLPGRQRAVLILRDVLGWKAEEVANLLDITVAAVNSALQRARADMKDWQPQVRPDRQQTEALLTRYVEAWESADIASLLALLREDSVLTMPPVPVWFRGVAPIKYFFDSFLFAGEAKGRFRLLPTRANGSPAFAVYMRYETGVYRPSALQILSINGDRITQLDDFLVFDDRLFMRFGLPLVGSPMSFRTSFRLIDVTHGYRDERKEISNERNSYNGDVSSHDTRHTGAPDAR